MTKYLEKNKKNKGETNNWKTLPVGAWNTYICLKEEIFRSLGDTDYVKNTTKILSKSTSSLAEFK